MLNDSITQEQYEGIITVNGKLSNMINISNGGGEGKLKVNGTDLSMIRGDSESIILSLKKDGRYDSF